MKITRKILILVIALCMALLCLAACGDKDKNDGGNEIEKVDYGTATVYIPGDHVQIITTGQLETDAFKSKLDKILKKSAGGGSSYGSLYSENKELEILIGVEDIDGTRPILDTASRYLGRIERDSIFEARYVIYADSGQIAIVFDDNTYTNLRPISLILEILAEKYLTGKDYMALPKGVVASGIIDLIEEQQKIDDALVAERWAGMEKLLGEETADALRKLYSMYDDKLIGWAANLYDPGVGGFYTCRTGRNGEEFGPDIECTVQLINFISRSGMVDNLSTDASEFLPEKMQQQMIYFAKSLQSKDNGYFYHPQWGQAATDGKVSRRGRDLGWAVQLLEKFGYAPAYDTPNGHKGDGITADEYWDMLEANGETLGPRPYSALETPTEESLLAGAALTRSLGTGAAVAVSKIVLLADEASASSSSSTTAYLQSHTNFINYLLTKAGPSMDANPYSMGNNFNATVGQISAQSKKLGIYTYTPGDEGTSTDAAVAAAQFKVNTDGDYSNDMSLADIYASFNGMTLNEMTIAVLNEKINPEIGLWGLTSESNPTGTEFLFTNGYFKVLPLYNQFKVPYPAEYVEKAASALMAGLLGDQVSNGNICDVYNIWQAIGSLKTNLKYLDDSITTTDSDGNTVKLKDKVRADVDRVVRENSAAAILNTYEKISRYKKEDGGFDHAVTRTGSGYTTQQGMNTGYAINEQSNIDATGIGCTGLVKGINTVYGIKSNEEVPIFTEADWMRMLEIFLNLKPVIKYSTEHDVDVPDVITFDEEYADALTVTTNSNFAGLNTWSVVKKDGNNMLFIDKNGKDTSGSTYLGGCSMTLKVTEKEQDAEYMICEFDVRFENVKAFDSQMTLLHSRYTIKPDSPFLLSLPKNMYDQNVHVIFTYRVLEKDENGTPIAFEVLHQINDGNAVRTTELASTATNIKNGKTPLPLVRDIKAVNIALNNSFLGDAYFDNMSLKLVSELPEHVNAPVELPEAETPEKELSFDYNFNNFLEVTTNTTFADKNRWTVVNKDGNNEFYISKQGKDTSTARVGGVTLTLKPTEKEANAKYAVLQFNARLENITGNETQIVIQHSGKIGKLNSPFLVNLPKDIIGENFLVTIIYEVTATDAAGNATAFRMLYYVNDELIKTVKEVESQATNITGGKTPLPTINSIESYAIALNNNFLGDAYFDNMSLKLLAELPEGLVPVPPAPETELSFDVDYSEFLSITTKESLADKNVWTVVSKDGNKELHISKQGKDTTTARAGGVTLTMKPTVKETNAKYAVLQFDLRFENVTANETQMVIQHSGKVGKLNSPFLFYLPKDINGRNFRVAIVYEVTASEDGKATAFKATYVADGKIIQEVVEVQSQATNITGGKTPLPTINSIESYAVALNNNFIGDAYFDNMSLKLLAELPEGIIPETEGGETPPEGTEPEEPGTGLPKPETPETVISFDYDYSSAVTVYTKPAFVDKNTWTIVEKDGNKKLFIDKAGKDTSGTTYYGGVTLTVLPTETDVDAKYMVFEADVRLEEVTAIDTQILIQHSGVEGKPNSPILFSLIKGRYNEDLHITIVYQVTATDDSGKPTHFRATYVVNGEIISDVTEIQSQGTNLKNGKVGLPAISDIQSIALSLNNNFLGDAYFDNISLKLLAKLPDGTIPS